MKGTFWLMNEWDVGKMATQPKESINELGTGIKRGPQTFFYFGVVRWTLSTQTEYFQCMCVLNVTTHV